jgi:type VI secretion system protein ImpB
MDGKTGAEDLIVKLLKDPDALKALTSAPNPNKPAEPDVEGSKP